MLEEAIMNKVAGIAAGLIVGWVVEQATKDILHRVGVDPRAARVAGAIAGALLS